MTFNSFSIPFYLLLTVMLIICGCSSGNHFMSKALESRSPTELMRVEASASANPRAPIRQPQPVPYIIDGKEVPYQWTASGKHVIHMEPGSHTFEGLIPAYVRLLPNPRNPDTQNVVYEASALPHSSVSQLPDQVSKDRCCVILKPQPIAYGEKPFDFTAMKDGSVKYIWKWEGSYRIVTYLKANGTFSGQANLYTWSEIVHGMHDRHVTGACGLFKERPVKSFSDWWLEIKEQGWQEN